VSLLRLLFDALVRLLSARNLRSDRFDTFAAILGVALGTATVDVVLNNTYYQEPRWHQLDLRFSRSFQLAGGRRVQPQFDIFNVTNSNPVLTMTTRIGPSFRNATAVQAPRVLRFGVNLNF